MSKNTRIYSFFFFFFEKVEYIVHMHKKLQKISIEK